MAKARNQFVCQQCGATFPKWTGRCENCGEWNSLVEQVSEATGASVVAKNARTGTALAGVKLDEATPEPKSIRLHTGIADLDTVLGGGFLPGGVVLVAGSPASARVRCLRRSRRTWRTLMRCCMLAAKSRFRR